MTLAVKDEQLGSLTRSFAHLISQLVKGSVEYGVAKNYVQRAIDSSKPGAKESVTIDGIVLTPELIELPVVIRDTIYRRHPNGGGLVAETAEVEDTVYVNFDARVSGKSTIVGQVKIFGNAQVSDSEIGGRARIGGYVDDSVIFGDAEVVSGAMVKRSRVSDQTKIAGKVAHAWFGGKTYIGADQIIEGGRHDDVIKGEARQGDPWFDD